MLFIKFIVLFGIYYVIQCYAKYCEICTNHILCKYKVPGPGPSCKGYTDRTAITTHKDINEIVSRINEKRNYIALGLFKMLPQAANMMRVCWSKELAAFAQRWVDQCDDNLHSNKEDQCRDLAEMKVGQNVATVLGPSPGLSVKSLVDMWFMQILDYNGSVIYYNRSQDYKTNYFTQLISAETAIVGCGRAKFYVGERNIIVERLVCNFAPKGNNYGKPIYTIGYPGTQCPSHTAPDNEYQGLCSHENLDAARKFTASTTLVSSLLRILDLSNNSVKRELDPVTNNVKRINFNKSMRKLSNDQENCNMYFSNRKGPIKRMPLPIENYGHAINNPGINGRHIYQQERGHSRVYHGYESQRNNFKDTHNENSQENFRRSEYTTAPLNYMLNRRAQMCTRKGPYPINTRVSNQFPTNQCSRMPKDCCQESNLFHKQNINTDTTLSAPAHKFCPCNTETTTRITFFSRCNCNALCQCQYVNFPTPLYPKIFLRNDDETRQSDEIHHYELFPNIDLRSGDYQKHQGNSNFSESNEKESINSETDSVLKGQVKAIKNYEKLNKDDSDYLYGTFDSSKKNRRELKEITSIPFWQMPESDYKNPNQLKSLRYTTLSNKKYRRTRTTLTTKISTNTESISIRVKDNSYRDHIVTERYLSFDELMHLRKNNAGHTVQPARRKADESDTTTAATTTTEVTANTPFIRKKHCTRKLTCTWTAFSMTGSDGNPVPGYAIDLGSRTPPGYVDGCTRTSTCTRDYMDRNKISTPSEDKSSETPVGDEDYCEKRSLNRRNSDVDEETYINSDYSSIDTLIPLTKSNINRKVNINANVGPYMEKQGDCFCTVESSREKRETYSNWQKNKPHVKSKLWNVNELKIESKTCPCNSVASNNFKIKDIILATVLINKIINST